MEDEARTKLEDVIKAYLTKEQSIAMAKPDFIVIDMEKLSKVSEEVAEYAYNYPNEFKQAVRDIEVMDIGKTSNQLTTVIFKNLVKNKLEIGYAISPEYNEKLVEVDGIITTVSNVKTYPESVTFSCPSCGTLETKNYDPFGTVEPKMWCKSCGKNRNFDVISKDVKKFQFVVISEMATMTSTPATVDIHIPEYLVDSPKPQERKLTPGTRLKVTGVLIHIVGKRKSAILVPIIYATDWKTEKTVLEITKDDETQILALSKEPDLLKKLIFNISPSIYGHEDLKEALLLQMVKGNMVVFPDGRIRRGSIHLLIVGDPGTAKTQLGRFVFDNYPRAKYTSASELTGAGLSVAFNFNKDLNQWMISPGVLVLANNSIAVIDEADKANKDDLKSLDVVMENQELPVDKAGISARFPARTSVLMLANPQFGRIRENYDTGSQVQFPETTLSRLDLKFIVQDKPEEATDKFIFKMMSKPSETVITIPREFLMKYIQYASVLVPQMTDEALEKIEEYFLKLRGSDINAGIVQITPRQGEAIMRLAEAYAKVRLSEKVEVDDALNSIRIFTKYLDTFGLVKGTNIIDIDKAEGRPSKEKRDKMTIIVETIRSLIDKNNGLPIAREHLINACKLEGLDETFLEKTIESLLTQGVFYSPTQNYLMMVR